MLHLGRGYEDRQVAISRGGGVLDLAEEMNVPASHTATQEVIENRDV
jgi:hypothetical protein